MATLNILRSELAHFIDRYEMKWSSEMQLCRPIGDRKSNESVDAYWKGL